MRRTDPSLHVRVSRRLLEKLEGRTVSEDAVRKEPQAEKRPKEEPAAKAPAVLTPSSDTRLALAELTEKTTRVGMLLLKKEKEETQQILELCSELLQQERRPQHVAVVCDKERAACQACLLDSKDTLVCKDVVNAFAKCAEQSWQPPFCARWSIARAFPNDDSDPHPQGYMGSVALSALTRGSSAQAG